MESYGKESFASLVVSHFLIVPITGELLRWIFVHDILQCGNAISSNCMCCREQNAPCEKESHGWVAESWTAEFCCQRWWCPITGRQEKHSLPICLAYSRTICSGNTVFGLCLGIRIFVWMTMFDNIWLTSTRSFHPLQLPKYLFFEKRDMLSTSPSGPKLLGLPAESFDVCLFSMVLHHWTQELQHESLQKVRQPQIFHQRNGTGWIFLTGQKPGGMLDKPTEMSWYDDPRLKWSTAILYQQPKKQVWSKTCWNL